MNWTAPSRRPDRTGSLPDWLAKYTTYGLYGLLLGTALGLGSLFTNRYRIPPSRGTRYPRLTGFR
jgi:hypothetical protein